ncbi:hypothetical protein BU16DRAFT_563702 [Lophium mytilinum]|uniref:Uncharacterized protein n=1 Tax=Lophium mytilinum TaxID=390894 RepID=A0A6A6QMQ7_9PEZI|nr:hypothetical protein BU16DRAFT_563702 [Lophium mytilinum]
MYLREDQDRGSSWKARMGQAARWSAVPWARVCDANIKRGVIRSITAPTAKKISAGMRIDMARKRGKRAQQRELMSDEAADELLKRTGCCSWESSGSDDAPVPLIGCWRQHFAQPPDAKQLRCSSRQTGLTARFNVAMIGKRALITSRGGGKQ